MLDRVVEEAVHDRVDNPRVLRRTRGRRRLWIQSDVQHAAGMPANGARHGDVGRRHLGMYSV
jgi:hypothetical protein